MSAPTQRNRNGERGFTLIESLMAISILAIVAVQILNVQSASITVTQSSRDNMRATWALRSAVSQMEYALDTVGPKGLPKEATFPWSLDSQFTVNVKVEDTPLEASRLLFTAMKMGAAAGAAQKEGEGGEAEDKTGGLKEIGAMLDSQIPKDMYRTAKFSVSWKDGDSTRTLDGGMLTIDTSLLNGFGDPSKFGGGALSGLLEGGGATDSGAAGGAGAGGTGGTGGGGETNGGAKKPNAPGQSPAASKDGT